jgi:uncharacterized membrane protein
MLKRLRLLWKHRWTDPGLSHRWVDDAAADRLRARVQASERLHTGQIRVCVESSLPSSYLWRLRGSEPVQCATQGRAMTWFGRLRVWDTERNNGVLIYLLLAEHAIEILADRGLASAVPPGFWDDLAARLVRQLQDGKTEQGLAEAIDEVGAQLVIHHPRSPSDAPDNELPDALVRA